MVAREGGACFQRFIELKGTVGPWGGLRSVECSFSLFIYLLLHFLFIYSFIYL